MQPARGAAVRQPDRSSEAPAGGGGTLCEGGRAAGVVGHVLRAKASEGSACTCQKDASTMLQLEARDDVLEGAFTANHDLSWLAANDSNGIMDKSKQLTVLLVRNLAKVVMEAE